MILGEPVPFDFADSTTQQSPLSADGSDYPCKFPSGFEPERHTQNAPMAPGSTNPLSFLGGATHGGGSCQVALTTDTVPTKDTKWEVIHSIEGGCPSDAEGNLSDDANDTGSTSFSYTIPEDMEAGEYTLAWTWFNKIGNREMYMNCAPIEIGSGGAAKRQVSKINKKRQSSRPDIMLANIGNGCTTSEGGDVEFPAPGDSLEKSEGANLMPPSGECGAASAPSGDSSSGSSSDSGSGSSDSGSGSSDSGSGSSDSGSSGADAGADSGADTGAATSAASPVASAAGGAQTGPAGSAATSAAGASAAAPTDNASNPGASAPSVTGNEVTPIESEPAAPAASNPSTGSTDGAGSGAPCTNEGAWVCSSDGTSYTRCASGIMSPPQPLNNGMKCTPGESDSLNMVPAAKRAVSFGTSRFASR